MRQPILIAGPERSGVFLLAELVRIHLNKVGLFTSYYESSGLTELMNAINGSARLFSSFYQIPLIAGCGDSAYLSLTLGLPTLKCVKALKGHVVTNSSLMVTHHTSSEADHVMAPYAFRGCVIYRPLEDVILSHLLHITSPLQLNINPHYKAKSIEAILSDDKTFAMCVGRLVRHYAASTSSSHGHWLLVDFRTLWMNPRKVLQKLVDDLFECVDYPLDETLTEFQTSIKSNPEHVSGYDLSLAQRALLTDRHRTILRELQNG